MTKKVTPIIGSPANSKTEKFKRPNHPDFMTADELKKKEFSGVRHNTIGLRWEFWILGEIIKTVSFQEVAQDKFALTKAHTEVFYMLPEKDVFVRK
jgi:hypothetical protein